MIQSLKKLSRFELLLWLTSLTAITASFIIFKSENILTLIASLIGVTALILLAKGNVWGQILTIVFSIFYAVISYQYRYFGEMITYLGMTLPSALMATVTWIRHPYEATEVRINKLKKIHYITLPVSAVVVTLIFYYILKFFDTNNLLLSTISITTSYAACYFMVFRSNMYALAYASNDIVLIGLWILASMADISFFPMIICFVMFLVNDLYGFYNWRKMKEKQSKKS